MSERDRERERRETNKRSLCGVDDGKTESKRNEGANFVLEKQIDGKFCCFFSSCLKQRTHNSNDRKLV